MSVLHATGGGNFETAAVRFIGERASKVLLEDLDGDNRLDALAIRQGSQNSPAAASLFLAKSDGSIRSGVPSAASVTPAFFDSGDIDGDGLLDLVALDNSAGAATVLLATGVGTFDVAGTFELPANPSVVRLRDADGDGIRDIVAVNVDGIVSVLPGLVGADFGSRTDYDLGGAYTGLDVADVNQDTIPDLLLTESIDSVVAVFLGQGSGQYGPRQDFAVGTGGGWVEAVDVNNDGIVDAVVGAQSQEAISVLLGVGDGTFGNRSDYSVTGVPGVIESADINGDGNVDLVSRNVVGFDDGVLSVFLNDGAGGFGDLREIDGPAEFDFGGFAIGDVNADGHLDIVGASFLHGVVVRFLGDGTGAFGEAAQYVVPGPLPLTLADTNLDGRLDVITGGVSGGVYVLLGEDPDGASGSGGAGTIGPRRTEYDSLFNIPTRQFDELGRETVFNVDPANGNVLSIARPGGLTTSFSYFAGGLVDTQTDALGRETQFEYDDFGRVTRITLAAGTPDQGIQRFEYDDAGNQTAFIDENNNRTEFEYDELNRLLLVRDPELNETRFDYDKAGNLVETRDSRGNVTRNEYDARNRLVRTIDADNQVTQFRYDKEDNLLEVIDPLGNRTRNTYDARSRLTETLDAEGGRTQFFYDRNDNLIRLIDPVGNSTTFDYDSRDRLVREVDPLVRATLYDYDAVDNLTRKSDRNGRVTAFEYDDLDRLSTETWLASDDTVQNTISYTYDLVGNLRTVDDAFSALEFTYDDRDRVKTVDNAGTPSAPNVVLEYAYDPAGNVLSVTDTIDGILGATTTYRYDDLNRVDRIQQSGSGVSDKRVDLAYNPLGQFASITRYSDLLATEQVVTSSYQYDDLNRLERLSHDNSAETVAFYDFVYDAASRIKSITDVDGTSTYTYDDTSQLTGADHTDGVRPDESYNYDRNGNRETSHLHGAGYDTDDGNRLLSDGTFTYAYDDEGNMNRRTDIATGDYRTFTWDHRNRLIAVVDHDSAGTETQRVEFAYDAFDRRIAKAVDTDVTDGVDAAITNFVYDREDVILDFVDDDGVGGANPPALDKRYLHGPAIDQILAQEGGTGNTAWYLADHLGTTRDLVDESGNEANHIVYDSFGNVLHQTNDTVTSRYLFTGREFDETGMYYYRLRYYDSSLGAFISQDPIGFYSNDTNLFRYVRSNPLSLVDPDGRDASAAALTVGGFLAVADGPLPFGDIVLVGIAGVVGAIAAVEAIDNVVFQDDSGEAGGACEVPSERDESDRISDIAGKTGLTTKDVRRRIHDAKSKGSSANKLLNCCWVFRPDSTTMFGCRMHRLSKESN